MYTGLKPKHVSTRLDFTFKFIKQQNEGRVVKIKWNWPCNRIPQKRSFKVLKITFLTASARSGILYRKDSKEKQQN